MNITTTLCWRKMEHLWNVLATEIPSRYEFVCTWSFLLAAAVIFVCACAVAVWRRVTSGGNTGSGNAAAAVRPESVNYHLTRQCNYKCGFCFHTAKTSFVLNLENAKRGLKLLRDAGK